MQDNLNEDDVSVKFINSAIVKVGCDEATRIRRQVSFTKGRVMVRGKQACAAIVLRRNDDTHRCYVKLESLLHRALNPTDRTDDLVTGAEAEPLNHT